MLSEISQIEKEIYDFTYMRNQKIKTNEIAKQTTNKLIDTENKAMMVARGEGHWGVGRKGEGN